MRLNFKGKFVRHLFSVFIKVGILIPIGVGLNYTLHIVLARNLSHEDYGFFSYVWSLTSLLAIISSLGFSKSMIRFIPTYRVQEQHASLSGIILSSFSIISLTSIGVGSILVVIGYLWSEHQPSLFWTTLLLLPLTISIWRENTMRGLDYTMEAIVPRQVLLPLLIFMLVLSFDISDITWILITFISVFVLLEFSSLLRLLMVFSSLNTIRPHYNYEIKHWLKVSIPMGLSALTRQGMNHWDIIIVASILGFEASASYTIAALTARLGKIILRVISFAIGPIFAELYQKKQYLRFKRLFISSTLGLIIIGTPIYIIVMFFSNNIMEFVGMNYSEATLLLQILLTGRFFNLIAGPVTIVLNMTKYEKINMILVFIFAGLNLGALLFFVPIFGVVAAAIINALTNIFLSLSLAMYLYFYCFKNENNLKI